MSVVRRYLHDIDLVRNRLMNPLLNPLTSTERLALSLGTADEGYATFDTTLNNIYFWDGSAWITSTGGGGTVTSVSVSPGTGISASVANPTTTPVITITNTAPDQTVVLNNGTGISVTGTYPNFTISSTGTTGTLVALPFTTDHITANGNPYVIGDVVYYLGNVYRCIAGNDSILPTNATYWTNLGAGFPLVQQPADWNATSGNNQILNKPTIPAAQVNSDWNAVSGVAEILNKPTIPTVGTWGALNYPTWTTGTPFVKMDAVGSFVLDTTSYQPLLTNPVTGTGTATRVAFWNSSSSISSDAGLYWDNVNKRLGVNGTPGGYTLEVIGTGFFNSDLFIANESKLIFSTVDIYIKPELISSAYEDLAFYTNNTEKLRIKKDGSVGIGTSTPSYKLDVSGTFGTSGQNTLSDLAGTGTRMVVAGNTGVLSTQVIPTVQSVGFEMNFLLMGA